MTLDITSGVRIVGDGLCYEIQLFYPDAKIQWKGHGFFPTLKMALEHLPDKVILNDPATANVRQLLRKLNEIKESIDNLVKTKVPT